MHLHRPLLAAFLSLPLLPILISGTPTPRNPNPNPNQDQLPLAVANPDTVLPDPDLNPFSIPTKHQSTLLARRLLALSPTAYLSTSYPAAANLSRWTPSYAADLPVALPEYIAGDCASSPGDPVLILLGLSTAARNVASGGERGGNVTMSVDWWDGFTRMNGGREARSKAGLPRMVLVGWLEGLGEEEVREQGLAECFFTRHPDARGWEPGRRGAAHEGGWVRFRVEGVYWLGGFGDRAWIGWVGGKEWRGVGEGEWRGVRLPGEGEGEGEGVLGEESW